MTHQSVLLQESLNGLDIQEGEVFLDGTFNDGGHSIHVCRRLKEKVKIIGIDLDSDALAKARERFIDEPCRISLHQENFRNLDVVLKNEGIPS
ncbi:MAG: 16S rRNA (cytosine(1402)-N(4))-methyltransferase, partial [Candidatus Paceibacterota bacterium]